MVTGVEIEEVEEEGVGGAQELELRDPDNGRENTLSFFISV